MEDLIAQISCTTLGDSAVLGRQGLLSVPFASKFFGSWELPFKLADISYHNISWLDCRMRGTATRVTV